MGKEGYTELTALFSFYTNVVSEKKKKKVNIILLK